MGATSNRCAAWIALIAAMSLDVISASPTSMAPTPASATFRTSSRVAMPLSLTIAASALAEVTKVLNERFGGGTVYLCYHPA